MAAADPYSGQFDGRPLDDLQLQVNTRNGDLNIVSALHIGFMETRKYVHFKPPNFANDTEQNGASAEEEEWLELAWFLEEDLHWVLKLPYHRFWSQIVYDESLHKCLESYLSQAPRYYDLDSLNLRSEILNALKRIHKLIFLIYLRMSTYKESKIHHITPGAFGSIIYENFIFDVPKMMDLCVLYGLQNLQIVSKMIQNTFVTQPAYFEDLNSTAQIVLEAFDTIEKQLSKNLQEIHGSSSVFQVKEVFPEACQNFYQNGAALRIATFYEFSIPAIEREVLRRIQMKEDEKILKDIKRKVSISKTLLVKVFRSIINFCCIKNIFSNNVSDNRRSSENVYGERCLDILMETASCKNFLHDYNLLFPFETDLDIFNEVGLKLDPQKLSCIFSSIHDTGEDVPQTFVSSIANGARPKIKKTDCTTMSNQSLHTAADILRGNKEESVCNGASNSKANNLTDIEINSLIEKVGEILHECDQSFIEKCLHYYDYDPDRVIDAYVTDNLPDHLKHVDETFEKELKLEDASSSHSILLDRKSIFDNDEFDVFRRDDINLKNVHIGKKNKTPSKYENLTNDEEFEFLKQYTLARGSEETPYVDETNLYEDEYDDTYDSAMVGLKEPIPEGEPDIDASEDKRTEESQDSSTSSRDRSKDFCENPEIIRERAQQRRESKMAARGARRGRSEGSSDSAHNRLHKDRNKARVGNHSRRQQADYKKSRGMMNPH
ncbi:activating signal cointegrator 1 complex subunit 2 [Nephila pilipes]|uniref:Activating signal cointegrator 1 complex subunit 2 n=1 Tax=Nephila pilipes TaxID=299642 RepID=A0A8X6MZ09_NEPPI|nr:activating signal cointegrator 1 complex subunit 2 [Nephila pilipes]